MPSRSTNNLVVQYYAWDSVANTPKTGDVANHTLRWIKDGTASAPTNSASEIDSANAPGVYKVTLTSAETTCHIGTLAGKSSTANVFIVPITITFELLPTNAAGTAGGVPTLDGNTSIPANVKYIDGNATNGNNATLSLKSLDIRNNTGSALIAKSTGGNGIGIDVAGHNTGAGFKVVGGTSATGDGSNAVEFTGGNAAVNFTGGHGLKSVGGYPNTAGNGGNGFSLEGGAGSNYGHGLYTFTSNGVASYFYAPSGVGLQIEGRSALEMNGDITGVNVQGDVSGIGITRPKKNESFDNFMFPMFDSVTKNPLSGLSVTAERAIDGAPYGACSSPVSEIGSGTYKINLSADDMNGEKVMLRFSSSGADDQLIEIITQD